MSVTLPHKARDKPGQDKKVMDDRQSLSVLIATHNRAAVLDQTLQAFVCVRRADFDMNFIVVDNNSTDTTAHVVESYRDRLPIRYLFEGKPGKNAALNSALERAELGDVIVFTDDDILPGPDWLVEVSAACRQWTSHSVFGGRVELSWPNQSIPNWATRIAREPWAFAAHNLGSAAAPYPDDRNPPGPNYWIRRQLIEEGYRFNEAIGPHPTNRLMGSETSFLHQVRAKGGYTPIFVPDAVVWHRIDEKLLDPAGICRRAFSNGRGAARQSMLRGEIPTDHKSWRKAKAVVGKLRWKCEYIFSSAVVRSDDRVIKRIRAQKGIGWHTEMYKVHVEHIAQDSI